MANNAYKGVKMSQTGVQRLLDSITTLERSIELAKESFISSQDGKNEYVARIAQYEGVVAKQRNFISSLTEELAQQNWAEVARYMKLINALSSLIHEDARSLLNSLADQKQRKANDRLTS
jgi:uncharacterized coiled-coil protein SlyX